MVHYDYKGRVALITGGASGIGMATAIRFAQAGAAVAVLDRDPAQAQAQAVQQAIAAIGTPFSFVQCDVRDEASVAAAVQQVVRTHGALHFAYNNAGVGGDFALVQDYPTTDWDFVMQVNLRGVLFCMKYELPAILASGGGAVVNCASLLSTVAYAHDSAYVASKFGVLGLTKNAALEYAQKGVRINAISPGFTRTPMVDKGDETKLARIAEKHPIGRLAWPDEIASGVLWLCSPDASFAIGTNLMLDGGYTIV